MSCNAVPLVWGSLRLAPIRKRNSVCDIVAYQVSDSEGGFFEPAILIWCGKQLWEWSVIRQISNSTVHILQYSNTDCPHYIVVHFLADLYNHDSIVATKQQTYVCEIAY